MKTIPLVLLPILLAACATTGNPVQPGAAKMPDDCRTAVRDFPAEVAALDGVALEDVEPPRRLHGRPPAVPRRGPANGYACVQAMIDTGGRVLDPQILGTNSPEYAANMVRAFKGWHFEPATLDGTPISVYYHLVLEYSR